MNQIRDWDGRCQGCGEETDFHTMSVYDVKLICMVCHDTEKKISKHERKHKENAYREISNDPVDW